MLLEMYRASGTGLRRRANPQSTPSAAMVPDMPSRKTVSSTASTNQGRHQAGQEQPGRDAYPESAVSFCHPSCSVAKSMSPSCDGPVNPRRRIGPVRAGRCASASSTS